MAFCKQCGSSLTSGTVFCAACGARSESAVQTSTQPQAYSAAPPPAQYATTPPPPPASNQPTHSIKQQKSSSGKGVFIGLATLLGVVVIGLGAFLFLKMGELNDARLTINRLERNVSTLESKAISLEGQLTAENERVASLNNQLTKEREKVDVLESDLSSARNSLTAAQGQITTLEADLNASKALVRTLEAEIAEANARISTLQANLNKANADLAAAQAANVSLTNNLNTIRSPRHFNSQQELTQWLAADDTNTNPAYSSLRGLEKAYVLQVKALRDGYIIAAYADWDNQYIYYGATAIAGGVLYSVDPVTDTVITGPSFLTSLRPLP